MSQQYYYNNAQYTTPTSYAGQTINACYAAPVTQTLSGYSPASSGRQTIGTTYNVSGTPMSSAHRSQAPVTYTYPSNATVMTQPVGQQTTLGKLGSTGPSFVIANGPSAAQQNPSNNGAYTVTTSYFQPLTGQVQHQGMAQAVAAAQQANFQVAMNVANSSRGRRNVFDTRFQNNRKNPKATPRSNIDAQVFYCDVCKISCAGPLTYKEHLDGQKHKKRASGNNVVPSISTKSSQRQLRCELCDVTCTGVDAYNAHIRGSKHQKTVKLHQRLGKPIPCTDPLVLKSTTVVASESNGSTTNHDDTEVSTQKTVGDQLIAVDKVLFQTAEIAEEHIDLNTLQDKSVIPIGSEYIETTSNENGKVVQYFCKLCACKFNDPHAKEMHLKGRRHRLQYKKKVDPSLVIDAKSSSARNSKIEEDKIRQKQQREEYWRRREGQARIQAMQQLEYSNIAVVGGGYRQDKGMRMYDTVDDTHVMKKHESIYPSDEDVHTIQTVVVACEKALRQISEILFDDVVPAEAAVPGTDATIADGSAAATEATDSKVKKEETVTKTAIRGDKMLMGAMRVGPLAKALLLRGELVVSLVLLCSKWPTISLLGKVVDALPEILQSLLPGDDIDVGVSEEYQCILVTRTTAPEMHCYIHLTSSVVREESVPGVTAVQPEDGLDRKRCLDALASLRHTKWFQAKVSSYQCLSVIRVLRDLCQRVPIWAPLSSWALELLMEKVVSSAPVKLSPGNALRRFFECVSAGVLLPGGQGLRDPCEKEITDASSVLSDQDREDITMSAQHALRLITFRQIHAVLAMEPLPTAIVPKTPQPSGGNIINARKRRHSGECNATEVEGAIDQGQVGDIGSESGAALKKDKKEPEEVTEVVMVPLVAPPPPPSMSSSTVIADDVIPGLTLV